MKELITKEGFDKIRESKKKIERDLAEINQKRAEMSGGGGGWHENNQFEFLEEQAHHTRSRLLEINKRILNLKVVSADEIVVSGEVGFGSSVDFEIDGEKMTYKVLGDAESDLSGGVISYRSALGSLLYSRKEKEEFEAKLAQREVKIKILKIY